MRLMVIIPDRLSVLIGKGEVTDCYYNPGNLADEVHIVMTNDDRPEVDVVRRMVGSARLRLHNLPAPRFSRTLGYQTWLLRPWIDECLALAREIRPDLVRTHNSLLEGYAARRIKDALGVPYVLSLHTVFDRDGLYSLEGRVQRLFRRKLEKSSVAGADAVIAIYKPLLRYASEHGARRTELIYNIVGAGGIEPKASYALGRPPRLITVNRQFEEKDPSNIIRAIKDIDCHYLLVGDGELHEPLKRLAVAEGCQRKVEFVKSIPNDRLCGMLKDFDLMLFHCDNWGISKGTIEGALAGLPIILNRHPTTPVPDLEGGWVHVCDDTPSAYAGAIRHFLTDHAARAALGAAARRHAAEFFDPGSMTRKTVALYREISGAS